MAYCEKYASPLGELTLMGDEGGLSGLWLRGQEPSKKAPANSELPAFKAAKAWLDSYYAGEEPHMGQLSLKPVGSDFQREVWKLLLEIPYGQVISYGELAKKLAALENREKMSARAIGGAVGRNPISIIIPCHRVIGKNGSLTGYTGGMANKIKLLELEGWDMNSFSIPKER